MTLDPYAPHLRQADDLFAQGEIVKAGQIWQAILKQQPTHAEARERLLAVKQRLVALRDAETAAAPAPRLEPTPEPSPAPAPEPPAAPETQAPAAHGRYVTGALDPERLLAEGCTLYDMGQLEDALLKWEQVLVLEPAHALARGYANGARRELGMDALGEPEAPVAAVPTHLAADEDIDKLLREAVQLYDMGLTHEAISKWERILVLDPHRPEIAGYLRQAQAEASEATAILPSPAAAAPPAPSAEPEGLALKLRQAEHLLGLQRHEEAAFTFQQALGLDPGNALALQGLERCRKPGNPAASAPAQAFHSGPAPVLSLDPQGRISIAPETARSSSGHQAVEPPATLLQALPASRAGLSLPERLREATKRLPWLKEPKLMAGLGGGILVLAAGLGILHSCNKDRALKEEVRAARATAIAPLAQQAQAPDLAESPAALREEAEATLVTDPLRAYLRAEALVRASGGDAAGAQLLEKARAGLAGGVTGASRPEFQKHLQNGDLEAALKVMDALLRAEPGDADLRTRAARLHLALCNAHASQAKWEEAREDLLRGRALFPGDKAWQARLQLLDRVKAMPKEQRPAWIGLLG